MILSGRRVILTGASGGIGREVGLRLAASGAWISLTGRNNVRLQALATEIRANGGRADVVVADLLEPGGPEAIVKRVLEIDPIIDVLVNCAGVSHFAEFERTPPEALERLWRSNVLAPMLLTQAVLPHLRRRKGGLVVNVGSIFGSIGFPCFAGYSATKFALRGFSEALRRELVGTGVGVLYFAPRYTRTAINGDSVQRMAEAMKMNQDDPAQVAHALVRAIECDDRECYLGASERFFVWLNQLLPRLVDFAMGRQAVRMRPFALSPPPSSTSL